MSALLEVRDLSVVVSPRGERQGRTVVRDAAFSVEAGSTTCIVGESGSGKTVLMRSLLGISTARPGVTAGSARYHSVRLGQSFELGDRKPGLPRGLAGYVFQHPQESLDPFRTVGRQVAASVGVAEPSLSRAQRHTRAVELLAEVALPEPEALAQLHPHELSGGMAQRAAIAVALGTRPELLVADEPTTGLDWSVRREIVELLKRLTLEHDTTLVLISHDFGVVEQVADRVLVLVDGELVESGPRAAFFAPGPARHPYSQQLQARARALRTGEAVLEQRLGQNAAGGEGCVHAATCALLGRSAELDWSSRCRSERPPLQAIGPDHAVRCFAEVGAP